MRYIAIIFVLLSFPALIAWMTAKPHQRHWAYFGIGLLPFTIAAWNLDVALINWSSWPGYAKGAIVTLLDSVALAIIATHRSPKGLPPFSWALVCYLLTVLLSVTVSSIPMAPTFYAFQLLRILILVVAVAKIAQEPRALTWLAMGLACGIGYQAAVTIWQKLSGVFQASGTLGHQNTLGMMAHFVIFPLLGMLFAGMLSKIVMLGLASSITVVALGASRGATGFMLGGLALLIMLSLILRSTPRKWRMVGLSALALLLMAPLMLQGMEIRFISLAQADGHDERAAFERAARAIIADHPMGIGANQYVVVANTAGYSVRAGVAWKSGGLATNVHNTYLLVAAETGWLGLLSFVAMFAFLIVTGLRFAFQNRRDPRSDIVLGCTVAVIICAGHNLYEWIFVTYPVQYVFGISVGIIAALVRARATEQQQQRRRRRSARPQVSTQPADAVASNS